MILTITKSVTLRTTPDAVWALLGDPPRVAGCLPNVQEFRATATPGRYETVLVERLGPFHVQIPLAIAVSEDPGGRVMVAAVSGQDRAGQARVRGEVRATVRPSGDEATLEVTSDVEVLGRLAALGAIPIRRRGDQVFEQFIAALGALLEEDHG
jgi:carbon monoxide dehydrogenase subunit G